MTRRDWLTAMAGVSPGLLQAARQLEGRPAPGRVPALAPDDPTAWSIAELGTALTAGRVTPLEIVDAYLRRIDRQNGALGAYVTVARDRATDEARRLLRGPGGTWARGPLTGVPVAHKDLFRTRGVRTTGGSRLYEHDVPGDDADVVARFTMAGAVLLGKTNTHELGGGVTTINPFFGTTHNPRDVGRIAGGSSGGSAAAIAAGLPWSLRAATPAAACASRRRCAAAWVSSPRSGCCPRWDCSARVPPSTTWDC